MNLRHDWTLKMNENLRTKTYTSHSYENKPLTHLDPHNQQFKLGGLINELSEITWSKRLQMNPETPNERKKEKKLDKLS